MSELQNIFVENIEELRNWLASNHKQSKSVWLVRWKKDKGLEYLTYDELVDELMCYGWVDSLPKNLDNDKTMIRISPRNPKSNWSKVNKERVERLTEEGRMLEPGLKMVDMAKAKGTWNFLDEVEELIVPDDLAAEFDKHPKARYYYERFPRSSKRGILEWIKTAKQAETRTKRIQETVAKAALNIKANHPKGRDAGPKDD